MARFVILLCFLLVAHLYGLECGGPAAAAAAAEEGKAPALYVFGDSYADTGNHDPTSTDADISKPWKPPYGSSWPGKPSGRYSDGRLFTDFYASQIKAALPIPFRKLNIIERERIWAMSRGINFAFGGSGVFSTLNPLVLNVSMQIQQLRTTIDLGIVSVDELSHSKALFVISGNDYIAYVQQYPDFTGIEDYIPLVVEQMANDLKILSKIGFKSFVVTTLAPLGCTPYNTYTYNYSECLDMLNSLSAFHNGLLEGEIFKLQQKLADTTFVTIDLFTAFSKFVQGGTLSLRPCCEGDCGIWDENGTALYTICSNPEATFYWDTIHPTNFGWKKVFSALFSSLQAI